MWANKLLLFSFFCTSAILAQTIPTTTLHFDEEKFDFGNIKISTKVSHIFYFTNTGKHPLILKRVTASCGCTTPQWDSLPIAPGKRGSFTVIFECFPLEKTFNKSITVESNAEPTLNYIDIRGKCIDIYKTQKEKYTLPSGRLLFDMTHVHFDKIYSNDSFQQKEIRFFNNSDDTITVFEFQPPVYIQSACAPNVIKPHQEGVIYINYNATLNPDFGFKIDKFLMLTNDKDYANKTLYASAEILEYFDTLQQNNANLFLKETEYDFGTIKIGDIKTHIFEIKNMGTDTLFIRNVRASCGCTQTILSKDKIAPGRTAQLKIIFNTAGVSKGVTNKLITLISTDRKKQVVHLNVRVNVE